MTDAVNELNLDDGRDVTVRPSAVGRMMEVVAPLASTASDLSGFVKWSGVAFGLSAMGLWAAIFVPMFSSAAWVYVVATVFLLVLLTPSAVVLAFYAGLRQLIAMPGQLAEMAEVGRAQLGEAYVSGVRDKTGSRLTRLFRFVRTVVGLHKLGFEGKGVLLQGAALVRLLNPITAFVVAASFAVGGLMVVVVAVLAMVMWVF